MRVDKHQMQSGIYCIPEIVYTKENRSLDTILKLTKSTWFLCLEFIEKQEIASWLVKPDKTQRTQISKMGEIGG